MEAVLLQHEPWVRAAAFAAVLLAMALWELLAPRRILAYPRIVRWPANLGIVVLNAALLRLAVPMAAVGLAAAASERGWGLLNQLDLPPWLGLAAAVLALDLVIYIQHVLFRCRRQSAGTAWKRTCWR